MNWRRLVAQSFQTAGSAGFPARHSIGRLESRPNPQARKPALHFKFMETFHDPMIAHRDLELAAACSAVFPDCGFGGLSSPPFHWATGKSPKPAGKKTCATFQVHGDFHDSMIAHRDHEPGSAGIRAGETSSPRRT